MSNFQFPLGIEVRYAVTGFRGVVTGRAEYISGCRQYAITPKAKDDGSFVAGEWLDEQRLVESGEGVKLAARAGGGPAPGAAPAIR